MFGAWLGRQCPNPSSCLPPSALNTRCRCSQVYAWCGPRMLAPSPLCAVATLNYPMCDWCRAHPLLSSPPRAWLARDVPFSPPPRAHTNDSSLSIPSIHRDHEGWHMRGIFYLGTVSSSIAPEPNTTKNVLAHPILYHPRTKHMLIESAIFFDP